MATEIWVNIGSGNGLLPDGTKLLPELMLIYHQSKAGFPNMIYKRHWKYKDQVMNHHFLVCLLSSQRDIPWWRHQMETFSALLFLFCGEFTGPGEFPTQRPVTRSFDVFFDLHLNKRLSKQPWGWWFETLSWSLWRCNAKATETFIMPYHVPPRSSHRLIFIMMNGMSPT